MARYERDFRTTAEEPLSLNELFTLLGSGVGDAGSREDAIACYLSGGEGWRDAVKQLGGTFADGATGLTQRKVD